MVTLGLLYALKGCGPRAFWRSLVRDYRPLFPHLPHRTRLFNSHRRYIDYFLADPSLIGVIDSYGIELRYVPYHRAASYSGGTQPQANWQKG